MTYEMYRYLFLGSAIASAVMLVVSLILFIKLRIPNVIGDLTGRNARKAIDEIRKRNERTGDKTYKSSAVNIQRGKLTDKISASGNLIPKEETPFGVGSITQKIQTERLDGDAGQTEVLGGEMTTLLQQEQDGGVPRFEIEFEITYIHTNEIIE